jgi:surface protein
MGYMFSGCSNLTSLDVSGFNTENVKDMSGMFSGCSNLTNLDVSGFNTEKVENMSGMFFNCFGLTTIYASSEWSTEKVTNGSNMFYGCTNLVGGKGTTFDWDHTDYIYARIDGGPEAPGYFTFKQNSGIKNLLTNEDKEKSIYSLGGQRLPSPQKGINIIGGKKVMVRSTPFLGR